jgi:hypothetical protein
VKTRVDLGQYDDAMRGNHFALMVKHYARAKGNMSEALGFAEETGAPQRVKDVLKAAVGAASVDLGSPTPWGAPLGLQELQAGFIASLKSSSAFVRMLPDIVRVPMRTRLGLGSNTFSAFAVAAGKPSPISRMDLLGVALEPTKVQATIVVTNELLRDAGRESEAAFGQELRNAVSTQIDAAFLLNVAVGGTAVTPSSDPMVDMRSMLNAVSTTGNERLFWVAPPRVANLLATLRWAAASGRLFPEASPAGGELLGLPLVVSNAANLGGSPVADSLVLVDARGMAGNLEDVAVDMHRDGSVEMLDSALQQDAVVGTGASMVSLWQTNTTAIRAGAWFSAVRFRPNAVAVVDPLAWS